VKRIMLSLLKNKRVRSLVVIAVLGAILEAFRVNVPKEVLAEGAVYVEGVVAAIMLLVAWIVGLKTPDADTEARLKWKD
jgi:hypothetical protein